MFQKEWEVLVVDDDPDVLAVSKTGAAQRQGLRGAAEDPHLREHGRGG
jgi:hypothetical protein